MEGLTPGQNAEMQRRSAAWAARERAMNDRAEAAHRRAIEKADAAYAAAMQRIKEEARRFEEADYQAVMSMAVS